MSYRGKVVILKKVCAALAFIHILCSLKQKMHFSFQRTRESRSLFETLGANCRCSVVVAYKAPFQFLINPTQSLHQQKPEIMKRHQRQFNLPSPNHGLAGMESGRKVMQCDEMYVLLPSCSLLTFQTPPLFPRYMTICLLSCITFQPQPHTNYNTSHTLTNKMSRRQLNHDQRHI